VPKLATTSTVATGTQEEVVPLFAVQEFHFLFSLEIRLQTLSLIEKLYKMTMKRQVIKESLQIGIQ
jgi:hypothetical protein